MRHLASLALMIVMLLTGVALGHARGQVMAGGAVILCSGTALRVPVAPGADGAPGSGHAAFCPDMAVGLLTLLWVPPAAIAPPALALSRAIVRPLSRQVAVARAFRPRARAPPAVAA